MLSDECPDGFDPASLLSPGGCVDPDCETAEVSPGTVAALEVEGPAGSGRYAALGYAVDYDGTRFFACTTASTVGWRHLYKVGDMLAPLPWFGDVDQDGAAEMIVWHRVPWGDSEMEHGLVPVPYAFVDAVLVRREVAGSPPARAVAAAYRRLSAIGDEDSPVDCYEALASALDPPR